jgi:pyrophosphate--fructose-6-phosphate 1-phosphotransferase
LGLTAGALLAHGYTCMMAALQKLTGPVDKWEVRGVPLTAMFNIERRKGKDKPVIKKALTELLGEPFKFFSAKRASWRLDDMYLNPGPIQFQGHAQETVTLTLQLEQKCPTQKYPGVAVNRLLWTAPKPDVLSLPFLGLRQLEVPRIGAAVKAGMPKTARLPIVEAVEVMNNPQRGADRLGVVFFGRQCPGAHNVVAGVLDFLKQRTAGGKLIGFKGGSEGLLQNETLEIDDALVKKFANQGGMDMLGRTKDHLKAEEKEQAMATCEALGLDGLIVVGGPTSNGIAAHLAEFFAQRAAKTNVVSVPAMIDGDMVCRYLEATVGFETATLCYSQLIGNLCTDAASAKKYYYFVRLMGRSASHTALECALQTRPTMCLISEEVQAANMSLDDMVKQIADMVEDRAVNQNLNYGVILVPEGIVEAIAELKLLLREVAGKNSDVSKLTPWARAVLEQLPPTIQAQMLLTPENSTGLAQVNNIETERLLAELVSAEMKRRKVAEGPYKASFAPVCFYLGYQARSSLPSLFDCCLGHSLGYAAGLLLAERLTGYCATVRHSTKPVADWQVGGVPLCSMLKAQANGSIALDPVLVDLSGNSFNEFTEQREGWTQGDKFRNPGPIQFDVPEMSRPLTFVADTAGMAQLGSDVSRMCDAIKDSLVGASAEYLHTAQVSLDTLQKVLSIVGRHEEH